MQLKTILNRVHKFQSFVYSEIKLTEHKQQLAMEVTIVPRANNKPICSGCGKKRPGYDTRDTRRFEFIPFWGILVFFVYTMRRVNCPTCGIKVESIPWATGKYRITTTYAWYLARWSKRMAWSQVADAFCTTWYTVYTAVNMAVQWGRQHVDYNGITAIGIDEIYLGQVFGYITLVYQINKDKIRLIWIGEEHKAKTLLRFFKWFGDERSAKLEFVCSDMWKGYLGVIARKAVNAINVLDRFHIVAHINKAIDKVRAGEAKELVANGLDPVLKGSRWWFLKHPENLTEKQETSLATVLEYNLKTIRSYLLKEDFKFFWEYTYAQNAGKFLDRWCARAMRSRIEPMKKVAKMLRNHRELILNYFRAKKEFSSGVVEGLNNKAKVTIRNAYGFRTYKAAETALYHTLGILPEPKTTHRFF